MTQKTSQAEPNRFLQIFNKRIKFWKLNYIKLFQILKYLRNMMSMHMNSLKKKNVYSRPCFYVRSVSIQTDLFPKKVNKLLKKMVLYTFYNFIL